MAQMFSESVTRKVLIFSAFYNIYGTLVFMFPGVLGVSAGLPAPAPFISSWFVASNILLFAFVAAWLSRRHPIDLPLLTVFGISKIIFFLLMLTSCLLGEVTRFGVFAAGVDLVMGIIFLGHARQMARRG